MPRTRDGIPDKDLQESDEAFKANIYDSRQVLPTLHVRKLLVKPVGNLGGSGHKYFYMTVTGDAFKM